MTTKRRCLVCGRPIRARGLCNAHYKAANTEINLGKTDEEKLAIEQSLIAAKLLLPCNHHKKNELRNLFSEYLSAKRRRRWPEQGKQSKTA